MSIWLALVAGVACDDERLSDPARLSPGAPRLASGSGGGGGADGLAPLSSIAVPRPTGGYGTSDPAAAVRLGKALFWDVQVGSDGVTACASCHYNGGADRRNVDGPNGVKGSPGVAVAMFLQLHADPANPEDLCSVAESGRQVTGANAPSTIGAVYYRDNFWDGRASHAFNGATPLGGSAFMDNASLASQAVGPANSAVEMACAGRGFNGANGLGAKLLARTPLGRQIVHPQDGVLGTLAKSRHTAGARGLNTTYAALIQAAYGVPADQVTGQFDRIWGSAVAAYEATLVPDRTPFDRYLEGDASALTSQQVRGLGVYSGKGNCTKCHGGAELSDATLSFYARRGPVNEDGGDQGYHNIGVTDTDGSDATLLARGELGRYAFSESGSPMDKGAVKTPGLRNVGLTAPYFHTGTTCTLEGVVDFYARGGDFRGNPQLSKRMQPISFSAEERRDLVAFMRVALTDPRVQRQSAPFDHPELMVPGLESPLPAVGSGGGPPLTPISCGGR